MKVFLCIVTLIAFGFFTKTSQANPLEIIHEFLPTPQSDGNQDGLGGLDIDTDQIHLIMSSRGHQSGRGGSATIFKLVNDVWQEQQTLRPPFDYNQYYGGSVAIQGNIAVVGAPKGYGSAYESGIAYVYELSNDVWSLTDIIQSDDGINSEYFGYSVVVTNNEIIIGSPKNDEEDTNVGAVDIFSKVNNQWTITQQLSFIPPAGSKKHSNFGSSMDHSNGQLIVSATSYNLEEGIVYSFEKVNNTWQQIQSIQASDIESSAYFGYKVAIDQNNLLISALLINQQAPGKIYLYQLNNNQWTEQSTFTPSNPSFEEGLGTSIAIYNNTVLAGADNNEDLGGDEGAVYLLEVNGNQLNFKQKLYNPDYETSSQFGRSVAVFGNQIIGANSYQTAYSFINNGTAWETHQFTNPNLASTNQRFGYLTEMNDEHAVIFASNRQDSKPHYLYFYHKNELNEWELSLKHEFSDVENKKGLALSLANNRVTFYGYEQLYVFDFNNNNWSLSSQHTLPYAKYTYDNNQLIEQAKIHALTHHDDHIATVTYDYVNKTFQTHLLTLNGSNLSIALLDDFTAEVFSFNKDISFINDILLAPFSINNPDKTDVVKIYRLNNNQWTHAGFIESPIIRKDQNFGSAISYDKQLLAIGATNLEFDEEYGVLLHSGEVHLYRFNYYGWTFIETIKPIATWPPQNFFGSKVYLNGETMVVKSYKGDGTLSSMNLHKFSKSNGWIQDGVYESNYGFQDQYAHDIAGDDNNIIVGIPYSNYSGQRSGRATIYKISDNYQLSGTVTNLLPGNTIKLMLNDRDIIDISQLTFSFDMTLPENHQYDVSVIGTSKPLTQACSVTNNQGTVGNQDITNIEIVCLDFVDLIFESSFEQ